MSDVGRPIPSGVIVFLMTDVEGSTLRWESAPEPMRMAVARHDALLRAVVRLHDGHLFKTAGDAFYVAFSSPAAAVATALAAQTALHDEDFADVGGLPVRMAVHVGPAEARDGDYFGPALNRCARLIGIAHGEQILISGAVAEMTQGLLPKQSSLMDLGFHRLKDVREPEHIHQLVAPGLRSIFPPLRSLGASVHNLPQQLTTFIGREADLADIAECFGHYRLITLVGPGGAGKTRVALEVASRFLNAAMDAVWLVELASLGHPQLVAEALCSTIGIPVAGSGSATESAVGFLRLKKVLLVLDNCEHLVGFVARLTDQLLHNCPSLLILATSRERLGVHGETPRRLESLALPPPSAEIKAAAALQYDAVRLFVERANASVQTFAITDQNASQVVGICRQLDGIPLAIELVVPQLRMLGLQALATRLRDRLFALRGDRTALPRHQTLGALFDWSYNLLEENERALFGRLSVFSGGWSLQGAIAVATDLQLPEDTVFDLLSALVDQSLVVADLSGDEARYRYLPPVWAYARGKLGNGQEGDLRRHLTGYLIARFREAYALWPTMGTRLWLARFEPEVDNLRASLDWAFGPTGDVDLAIELSGLGVRIWDELSLFAERERWVAAAFGRMHSDVDAVTMARLWLGHLSNSAHGDKTNLEPAVRAATLFREAGDMIGLGEAMTRAGAALESPEQTADALPYLQEGRDVLKPLGPTKQLASCLRSLGVARYLASDFAGARPLIAQSGAVAGEIGDTRGIAAAQIASAELAFAAGDAEGAITTTRAMLDGTDCNLRQAVLGLSNLAAYLLASERTSEAERAALDALNQAQTLGWRAAVVRAVEHLALVAALRGNSQTAARLLGFTVGFYAEGSATREFTELATYHRLTSLVDAAVSPEEKRDLMSDGATWTQEQAMKRAASRPDSANSTWSGSASIATANSPGLGPATPRVELPDEST